MEDATPECTNPAELLQAARLRAGLSQRELSIRSRTAQSVISRIETRQADPRWSTIRRLLGVCGYHAGLELREGREASDPGPPDKYSWEHYFREANDGG
jgi:transcriptional regulator with XRE-family HTH domain